MDDMDKIFSWEQWRMIFATTASPLFAYLTPTKGFIYALVVMFAFNIWAGMRADGVAIVRCKNFSFRKFKNALFNKFLNSSKLWEKLQKKSIAATEATMTTP